MKNFAAIIIFFAIIGGGYWLISDTTPDPNSESTDGAEKPDPGDSAVDSKELEGPQRPVVSKEGPWPKMVVSDKEFSFGSMLVGTEKEHTFTISNAGEADLELLEGKATCKCTQFSLATHVLKPGEETELTIRWVGKFKDPNFSHGGPVYSNDPNAKDTMFSVKGVVDEPIEVLPSKEWYVSAPGGDAEATFDGFVISRVFREFAITSIEGQNEYLTAETQPMDTASTQEDQFGMGTLCGYKVTVKLSPDAPPGITEHQLVLHFDHVDVTYPISIRARKEGPVKVLPPAGVVWSEQNNGLGLGRFPAAKGREITLDLLVNQMDTPLECPEINVDPPYVKAELASCQALGGGRQRCQLKIQIPAGIPRSSKDSDNPATIDISTNHPTGQSINLKLSYTAF